jgi:hypothetical protein
MKRKITKTRELSIYYSMFLYSCLHIRKPTSRNVTPIPDVSRKSGTCVNISTGYIKIYNINYIRMNIYATNRVRTYNNINISSIHRIYILDFLGILKRYERALVETSIRLQACITSCLSETNKDWDET